MGINAFTKTGNTVTFTAGVTAPTPVQVTNTTIGGNQYDEFWRCFSVIARNR